LFDPETYKGDSSSYSISQIYPSIDGSKIAFEVAPNGSESAEMLILNVETNKLYPEVINRCWSAGASWLPGGERFLFAAAIPEVGCLNTMRQEFSPNGPANVMEFGTVKDSTECMALYEMDAYQHVVDGEKYPATLITAGINDPRVIAWQPAKFAARLQAANKSNKPILFLVDYEAGHGMGDTKTKLLESMSDIYSFALWQTGHPDFKLE